MDEHRRLEDAIGTEKVLVVNSAMEIKAVVRWQKAVTLMFDDKCYTLIPRTDGSVLRSPSIEIEKPLVVCLSTFHKRSRRKYDLEDEVTKAYVRQRDKYTCQYCFKYGYTVDHIQPKSRGGKDIWGNLVTACLSCNGYKADRTPEEAGMKRPYITSGYLTNTKHEELQAQLHKTLISLSV